MITIQNGKLIIPDSDRFVGFAGDNTAHSKQFVLIDPITENESFTLCMRFDDDSVYTVPLAVGTDGGYTVLTWEIRKEHLCASGIVQVQVKIADSDGNIEHTTKDFFLIGSTVELDDSGEMEYVTTSQMRNSINQALRKVTATAPYIDADGYWCVYDTNEGRYVRTPYHVGGYAPDSAMSDSSDNTVSNSVIKRYVDDKAAELVPSARKIAQLSLSADVGAETLMTALRPYTYKTNITPNDSGVRGQLGIGAAGEVFFCTAADKWSHLVNQTDLSQKMDLATEIGADEVADMDDGSIFFRDGLPVVKKDGEPVALAQSNDVYSKTEINGMIGDLESLLALI